MDLNIVREVKGHARRGLSAQAAHRVAGLLQLQPAIFKPQKGANQISMAGILLGQQCGVCHGKVAFPVSECRLCHSKPKSSATAEAMPTTAPASHQATR